MTTTSMTTTSMTTTRMTTNAATRPDSQIQQDQAALHAARRAAKTIRARAADLVHEPPGRIFLNREIFAPHMEDLVTIFNNIAFSPAYHEWQDKCRAALVKKLTTTEEFTTLLTRSWKKDTGEALLNHATKLSHAQQEIYALPAVPLSLRIKYLPAGATHDAHHCLPTPGTTAHTLAFRVSNNSDFRAVDQALSIIFHENTHATQAALGLAQRNKILPADHPLYRDAALFYDLFADNISYIPHSPAYKAHPLERDAFAQSDLFVTEIKTALKARGLSLPPR